MRALIFAAALAVAAPAVVQAQAKAPAQSTVVITEDTRLAFREGMDRSAGEMGRLLREVFPQEYLAFETEVLEGALSGKLKEEDVAARGYAFASEIMNANAVHLRRAPTPLLVEVTKAQLRVLKVLQRSQPVACYELGENGQLQPERASQLSADETSAMAEIGTASLKAIRAARAAPVEHGEFGEADAALLFETFAEMGGDMAWLEALGAGDVSGFSARQRCDNIVLFNAAMTALPSEVTARIVADSASE